MTSAEERGSSLFVLLYVVVAKIELILTKPRLCQEWIMLSTQ